MKKYKLAIIGSGSLGSIIGRVVSKDLSEEYEILGVLSGKIENAIKLAEEIDCKAYKTLDDVIDDQPDYIIEAASPDLFKDIGIKILANGINLIPLSVGALADKEFYNNVKETASKNNCRVHIPAGAVGGLDVLRASMLMEDAEVTITTEKSPESLNGAPFLKGRKLSEEHKKAISIGGKGRKFSDETRKKMSESMQGKNLGKKQSEETKEKISKVTKGNKNPFYGKTHTEEQKRKWSQCRKGKILTEEHIAKLSKQVICV
ncbi:MAG: NUMOD3 domain-containing DNA-binding protein, partial [Dysgonamonadaceae bacterium]